MTEIVRRLRTPAAAEYLGLSASTLEKFRVTGGGPAYYKSGPKIVVYETLDLDAWLHARRQVSTSDTPRPKKAIIGSSDKEPGQHVKEKFLCA